jgi:hypothetical protein
LIRSLAPDKKVITEESAMNYVMAHSAPLMRPHPKRCYHTLFSPLQDTAIMARDILVISRTERW